ncbi:MAG: carbohydrate ABC transporter permease [Clostridia bacterium]|nr:carbohydrate ABC transporter permease [Clostridia bacterium]
MQKTQKMRVRNHQVVLNRSVGGDAGIFFFLAIMGVFMFLPMYYVIIQSLKPLDELWMFPPRFYVIKPTGKNFGDLFSLLSDSWVPFSRYIFNTVFITAAGTFGNLFFSSLAAYAVSKIPFPGRNGVFWIIQKSLMFTSTVTAIANFLTLTKLGLMDNVFAIIIPAWGSTMGLYLMKQFMDSSISNDVLESARLDGCSEFKTFWVIAMPMVKPAWLTLIIYSFQGLWNTGASPYIFSEQYKTLNYAISQITAGGIARAGASAAGTVIMMIVPILVFVISQSNIIETMASSGMKD